MIRWNGMGKTGVATALKTNLITVMLGMVQLVERSPSLASLH